VLAGAGTGKTRTLTNRCAWLLEQGVRPGRLLLLTFTNRAAREMITRLGRLTGIGTASLWAGTFHHVAHRLLRAHGAALGLTPDFEVLGPEAAASVLQTCLDELAERWPGLRLQPAGRVAGWISAATNQGLALRDWIAAHAAPHVGLSEVYAHAAERYAERKVRQGRLDFDDLLLGWRLLLGDNPRLAAALRGSFDAVLVDEVQDINELQADLVELMAAEHRSLTLVGDDAQAIYGFRGANVARILELPHRMPDLQVLRLEQNYRSSPEILAVANRTLRHNRRGFRKQLRATRPSGPRPALVYCADEEAQARWVTQRLRSLVDEGLRWRECAVLYRRHSDGERLRDALEAAGVPWAQRVAPGSAPGPAEQGYRADSSPASADHAAPPEGDSGVTCSSVHQAKGLEWRAVFVLNLVEGCFPLRGAAGLAGSLEEERRLFHVAVTRAREHLFLLCPRRRSRRDGPGAQASPSRFVSELACDPPLLDEHPV